MLVVRRQRNFNGPNQRPAGLFCRRADALGLGADGPHRDRSGLCRRTIWVVPANLAARSESRQPSRLDADRRGPGALGLGGRVDGSLATRAILSQPRPARAAPRNAAELVGLVRRHALAGGNRTGRIYSAAFWGTVIRCW